MTEYKFYKENDGKWYIDLSDYTGPKEDLEMVMGADTMLNIIDNNSNNDGVVYLILSEKYFNGSNYLTFKNEEHDGANYNMPYYNGIYYNLDMWLCSVTKFVFNKFPENIYFVCI